ncbi:unnamed protein product [Symbiodinium pilosum]|uniref:Uncharacterized protein n=1 Tax=Symbiodinium pilosum TaxID=2952 RepID=A0A812XRF4_SYMPI|nr:unnamed protein product [Symbiodinium pilosum]
MSGAPNDGAAGAAAAVGNAALSGARMGAAAAQRGVVSLSIYVQHNPSGVKVFCCLAGLALSTISILSIVGVAQISDEDHWTARDSLQNVYTFIFGLVICIIDMKEEWANKVFGLQSKIFLYCQFLASQTGRALFYFYVGLLPSIPSDMADGTARGLPRRLEGSGPKGAVGRGGAGWGGWRSTQSAT